MTAARTYPLRWLRDPKPYELDMPPEDLREFLGLLRPPTATPEQRKNAFLKGHEIQIRRALSAGNLAGAHKLVNGGSHGLADFADAYNTGNRLLPDELSVVQMTTSVVT